MCLQFQQKNCNFNTSFQVKLLNSSKKIESLKPNMEQIFRTHRQGVALFFAIYEINGSVASVKLKEISVSIRSFG